MTPLEYGRLCFTMNYLLLILCMGLIGGCATIGDAIKYRELDVVMAKAADSDTLIFKNKPTPEIARLYLDITDETGHNQQEAIQSLVQNNYQRRGYGLAHDSKKANISMYIHIVFLDRIPPELIKRARQSGGDILTQGTLGGGALGAALGVMLGGGKGAAIGGASGAIGGGLAEKLLASTVRMERYALIVNVAIDVSDGSRGGVISQKAKYVFMATKTNLTKEEAFPALVGRLTNVLSGLL